MSISKYMYIKNPRHNMFDLSHSNVFTCSMGQVIPNLVEPMYPGDVVRLSCTSKTYTMPMITSPFQRIDVRQRFFFVPLRELMELGQFDEYITGGKDLATTVVRPTINTGTGIEAGSLMDYLGYPASYTKDDGTTRTVANRTVGAWALRAYNKIINDYYINLDVEEERSLSLAAGLDEITDRTIFQTSWGYDYFTENLPASGRGASTEIPIGEEAGVKGNGMTLGLSHGEMNYGLKQGASSPMGSNVPHFVADTGAYGTSNTGVSTANGTVGVNGYYYGLTTDASKSGIVADLSAVSGVNVDELFALFGIDAYKKLSMRVGSKINEFLLGIWGVQPRDLRLHRSLYLGGRSSPLLIEEVDQTSQTTQGTDGSPLGTLAGRGVSVNYGSSLKFKADDYGLLIGFYTCMPQAKYFQGVPRWMDYEDFLDWPNPRLAMLGDQTTYISELYAMGDNETETVGTEIVGNKTIFGFNNKYEEVRNHQSEVHGQMRTTLKHYHLAREFANAPLLNSSFLRGVPSKRIFSVTSEEYDSLRVETGFKMQMWRKFPKYGTPAVMRLFS